MKSNVNLGTLSAARRWTVLASLLLICLATAAPAFHSHRNELPGDAKSCTICQVAHAPASVGPAAQLAPSLVTASFFSCSSDPDPKQGLDAFSLFCRPPPQV